MYKPRILGVEEKTHELISDLESLTPGTTLDSKIRYKKCGKDFLYKNFTIF